MGLNQKTVFYNMSVLAISNTVLQLLNFVYRIFLSNLAGAEGLGIYRLVLSVYTVINSVCLSGIVMAISKMSSQMNSCSGERYKINALKNFSYKVFIGLFCVCDAAIIYFNEFIAENILGDIRSSNALSIMLFCLFLTGFENINKAIFIGIQKVKYIAISETAEQLIRMLVVLTLLYCFYGCDYSVVAFLIMLGMTISEIFSVVYLTYAYRKSMKFSLYKKEVGKVGRKFYKDFFSFATPVCVAALINNVISSASSIILPNRLVAAGFSKSQAIGELGIISGMTLPLLILPIALISSVSTIIMPNIAQNVERGNIKKVKNNIYKSIRLTGLIGVPATCAIVPLAPTLAKLFFLQDISVKYMFLLGVSVILMYYEIITSSVLNGLSLQTKNMGTSILGEIIQLVLVFKLCSIPEINVYGYIIAMIISPIFVLILNFYFICREIDAKFDLSSFVIQPGLCGACVYLWVRVIYYWLLGVLGSQIQSVFFASISAAFIYLVILKIQGIHIFNYLKSVNISVSAKNKINIFSVI